MMEIRLNMKEAGTEVHEMEVMTSMLMASDREEQEMAQQVDGGKKGRGRPRKGTEEEGNSRRKQNREVKKLESYWRESKNSETGKEIGVLNVNTQETGQVGSVIENNEKEVFLINGRLTRTLIKNRISKEEGDIKMGQSRDILDSLLERKDSWEKKEEEKWDRRMAELEEMLRKEYICKNERCEKKRKEETEQEAEIRQLKGEVERGKMEISTLKKLLEQFQEAGDKYDEPRRSPSTDSMTLTHVAASTTERFEEDKTGGDDRGTGSTNLPPEKLSREEWNEEIQVRRAKKKTVIIGVLTFVTKEMEELEGWMWNILQIKARVKKLERTEGGCKAELEEWKAKLKLMKEKTTLGDLGWGVWIKDDLTERQEEVKTWLEKEVET